MKIVNLRTARKRRAKAGAAKRADANRIAHGMGAAHSKAADQTKVALTRKLDAHRIPPVD
ncbi:DUF4169 family protein [uncultured Algimonas sp.]|uniref:DUF4169 family protein n=1 Tax=uncultured Algimonas sp. TaxID=1547920 RepID=UPI0026255BEF|nr:DUF4169 family protein [uncultured Algimonas sp.]